MGFVCGESTTGIARRERRVGVFYAWCEYVRLRAAAGAAGEGDRERIDNAPSGHQDHIPSSDAARLRLDYPLMSRKVIKIIDQNTIQMLLITASGTGVS